MWSKVTVQSKGKKRGKQNTRKLLLALFLRETPLCVYTPREALFEPDSKQRLMLLAVAELSKTRTLGTRCSASPRRVGSSVLDKASFPVFPESLLRYSCLKYLFLDQVHFSACNLKNICLMLEDKSPTWQKNLLTQGFLKRVEWGGPRLQVEQNRKRQWATQALVQGGRPLGWLHLLLSCFI